MKTFNIVSLLILALPGSLFAQQVIRPGRAINITIKGVSVEESQKFNGVYPVADDGTIRLPNLDSPVRAGGLNGAQASKLIEAAYRSAQIYRSPVIQVIDSSDTSVVDLQITIGGQVRQPGPRKFTQGMTLYQAVSAGGGATEFGSMMRVNLIREGKSTVYDLTENANKSLAVQPNDTVEVPQKDWLGR